MDISAINKQLKGKSPEEIVAWALNVSSNPIVTTNFRPYEAAILHVVSCQFEDIPVIWCDSGYNTPQTYKHAERTIDQLALNVDVFIPEQTAARRDALMGIPEVDTPEHDEFTRQVKLEPFQRAMKSYEPDLWFTNLRKGQTALRDQMDIVNMGADGMIKVCPFFHWSDNELDTYLEAHGLESEDKYYDPTKALANRECGLHVG